MIGAGARNVGDTRVDPHAAATGPPFGGDGLQVLDLIPPSEKIATTASKTLHQMFGDISPAPYLPAHVYPYIPSPAST
jgi:hypothetical protein